MLFAKKSRKIRRETIVAFMNLKMKFGQVVKDHMIEIIGHFNEAKINGAKIDKKKLKSL